VADVAVPAWVQTAIALGTPITGVLLYIFGRGSASGVQTLKIEQLAKRSDTMEVTLAANVAAVSNHSALLQVLTNDNKERDAKLDKLLERTATLMERTRKGGSQE
jgi:hypothetical protein